MFLALITINHCLCCLLLYDGFLDDCAHAMSDVVDNAPYSNWFLVHQARFYPKINRENQLHE
jgi:hypothetical protein